MKKIFWVGCVLAGVALFASCRGESGKTVEGTPIGQGLIIKKTEAGKLQLCDSLGSSLAIEDYDEIDGNAFFIIARTGDNIALYRNNGQSLTRCDSFAIHRYYPVTADERERRYLETIVDGAHRAFDLDSLTIRSATEGVKDGIWPMPADTALPNRISCISWMKPAKTNRLCQDVRKCILSTIRGR